MQSQIMLRCVWQVEALIDTVRHAVAKCPKTSAESSAPATNLYEVLYIGKVVVSTKKAPPSFIDDAVAKFDEISKQVKIHLSLVFLLRFKLCCITIFQANVWITGLVNFDSPFDANYARFPDR